MIRDGDWTLYDHDFQLGRTIWHLFDGEKDVFRVDYQVEGLLNQNAELRASAESAWRGDWHRVASIPLNVAYDSNLVRAQTEGDDAYVKRWLNDSDNRGWRTKEGRV